MMLGSILGLTIMFEKKHVQTLLWFLFIVYAFVLLGNGFGTFDTIFKPISIIVSFGIGIIELFERWFWKCKLLHPWFVSVPNISGAWKGLLISNYINPKTGQKIDSIEIYFIIHQTFSTIKVKQVTVESTSHTIGTGLSKINEAFYLVGTYQNIPKLTNRGKSSIHHGAFNLEVCVNKEIIILEGSYWTDRNTQGEIRFMEHTKTICSTFDNCEKNFNENLKHKKT